MSAIYDFYKNPNNKSVDKKTSYHARIVTNRTVSSEELATKIHARCSMTTADVKGVLSSLSDVIIQELKDGNRVYIEGLGYLQLTLSCPSIQKENEINAQSIQIKSVAFRPENKLKEQLKDIHLKRAEVKSHSKEYSVEETDKIISAYFQNNETLTRNTFEKLFGYTRTTANRRLKELVDSQKLHNIGLKRFPIYQPTKGNYGK